jgi:SPP1 gp7 family putative phage head morphogenesis protein
MSRTMPRKPRRWAYPAALERAYVRSLVAFADEGVALVRRRLTGALQGRQDAAEGAADLPADNWHDAVAGVLRDLRAMGTSGDARLREIVLQVGRQVKTFNGQQLQMVLRSAYGVNVIASEPNLAAPLRVWEAENLRLIKSVPEQYATQLEGRIVAAVQRGATVRTVQKEVAETYKMPRKRAELIARDQIGKLNGQLTKIRQQNVGIEEYTWRGVLDRRERPEHRAREGKVYRWSDPPADGNPGDAIRCRCSAEAVLPDLEDLKALIRH